MKQQCMSVVVGMLIGAVPLYASAQDMTWFNKVVDDMLFFVLPGAVTALMAIALVVFIWGLVKYIAQSGNEQAQADAKRHMIWGIVALFVLVSMWGLVALMQEIAGVNPALPHRPQTIYN